MTSVIVTPSEAALCCAASHSSSEIRTVLFGVAG